MIIDPHNTVKHIITPNCFWAIPIPGFLLVFNWKKSTKITEVNLSVHVFVYRLFHEDLSPILGTNFRWYLNHGLLTSVIFVHEALYGALYHVWFQNKFELYNWTKSITNLCPRYVLIFFAWSRKGHPYTEWGSSGTDFYAAIFWSPRGGRMVHQSKLLKMKLCSLNIFWNHTNGRVLNEEILYTNF